jgi:hypothetical protein
MKKMYVSLCVCMLTYSEREYKSRVGKWKGKIDSSWIQFWYSQVWGSFIILCRFGPEKQTDWSHCSKDSREKTNDPESIK